MPIDKEQRKRNTFNKMDHLIKRITDNDYKERHLSPNSQGEKGKSLVSAHRIHSGKAGGDEIMDDHAEDNPKYARKVMKGATKTIEAHRKKGYGYGHDMKHLGEGQDYDYGRYE